MASADVEQLAKQVEEFKEITGADDEVATRLIQICQGDLQMAINMHVDGGGIDIGNPPRESPPTPPMGESVNTASSSSGLNGDYVRPPLPPKQEVLVESYNFNPYLAGASTARGRAVRAAGLIDPFRNFERETLRQEEELSQRNGLENLTSTSERKASTIEDLFKPPLDIMFKGSLEAARADGRARNKWILVNVINLENFNCQTLNRDVWSEETVKDIIKDSFIFWQVYHESEDFVNYNRFYPIESYPHIAIIDPRTGERVIVWSKLDTCTFLERVTDFLSYKPSPDPSRDETSPTETSPPTKRPKSNGTNDKSPASPIEIMDEDEQMKAAIAASLEDSCASSSSSAVSSRESHTKYLGPPTDPMSELVFRYPNGERKVHSFPSTSKVKALTLFADEQGFSENSHELVTNYPRRNLSETDSDLTLNDVGLYPKETIFIQLRSG